MHRIQSQKIELEFSSSGDQPQLLNLIRDTVYEEINPAIEHLLNEANFLDELSIKEEKLVLDIGVLSENNWRRELKIKTVEAMNSWLSSKKPMYEVNKGKPPVSNRKDDFSKPIESKPAQDENYFPALIYFLRNGFLPWDYAYLSIESIEQYFSLYVLNTLSPLYRNENFTAMVKAMLVSPSMLYRFKEQFKPSILKKLTTQLTAECSIIGPLRIIQDGQKMKTNNQLGLTERLVFIASIINWYASIFKSDYENNTSKYIREVGLIFSQENLDLEKDYSKINERIDSLLLERANDVNSPYRNDRNEYIKEKTGTSRVNIIPVSASSESASLFIHNAGLVLLHPYINMLFQKLHYTDEDHRWVDDNVRMKAPLLLQYLVTGHSQFEEQELIFNKFLCGIPFHEPVPFELLLTKEEINTCQGLLESVIAHWTILKSTSIEGLRNSFLMREGKLSKEETWQLIVENKAWDVLLAQLPWGISMVKTPWMEELLYVNWT